MLMIAWSLSVGSVLKIARDWQKLPKLGRYPKWPSTVPANLFLTIAQGLIDYRKNEKNKENKEHRVCCLALSKVLF